MRWEFGNKRANWVRGVVPSRIAKFVKEEEKRNPLVLLNFLLSRVYTQFREREAARRGPLIAIDDAQALPRTSSSAARHSRSGRDVGPESFTAHSHLISLRAERQHRSDVMALRAGNENLKRRQEFGFDVRPSRFERETLSRASKVRSASRVAQLRRGPSPVIE